MGELLETEVVTFDPSVAGAHVIIRLRVARSYPTLGHPFYLGLAALFTSQDGCGFDSIPL